LKKKSIQPAIVSSTEDYKEEIYIKGARSNNLKNIDVKIPKNKLVVVAGVSGSGKSSLTMDTLFAEGQRRYVESLSSYARQFLMRMKKPEVDFIKGICPAIAIEQKVSTSNARSTVGSMTEIYDFLRLLFARIGKIISPISGEIVKRHEVSDVVDFIHRQPVTTKVWLYIPLLFKYKERTLGQDLDLLRQKGYGRIRFQNEIFRIDDFIEQNESLIQQPIGYFADKDLAILIDRFVIEENNPDNIKRIADSIQTAIYEAEGICMVSFEDGTMHLFSNKLEADGMTFLEPTPQLFNYNNSFGACPTCEGYGKTMGIDEAKVIPDTTLSVYSGAIACWRGETGSAWVQPLLEKAHAFDFPVHRPYEELTKDQKKLLWQGNRYFEGINAYFQYLTERTYKIQNRITLARYRGKTTCPACEGQRLRKEALCVKIYGKTISDLTELPIDELMDFFDNLQLSAFDTSVGNRLLFEIKNRIKCMMDLGLPYLTLSRLSSTLSGGETQRINLTRTLGSNLTSSMYILDEPSIGLHPKDTKKLVSVLKQLRDLGNTVIVVEHEEAVLQNADYLIDVGPHAGVLGGEIVFSGTLKDAQKIQDSDSLTLAYLLRKLKVPYQKDKKRKLTAFIEIKGARQHNLKNIDIRFPLQAMTVVSGVSGSGKTTLVKQILYPALKNITKDPSGQTPGAFDSLEGAFSKIQQVEMVNQQPIGKSSRSNPVTYVKAYDAIRDLFADQPLSRVRGYKPKHFSFNVEGGRCETCKGEGEQVIEMQFLADVHLECEDCKGKRFQTEILDIQYKGKNIFEILDMTIEEAMTFFADKKEIFSKIRPLYEVGLGYVKLGQSSNTLSGGEAQRVKLAYYLTLEKATERYLFIFDEPTTGLHYHDISKLLTALNALVDRGHSVLIVEHNLDVIQSAEWVIDLGPEGGKNGGQLLYQGELQGLLECKNSHTAHYLKEHLAGN